MRSYMNKKQALNRAREVMRRQHKALNTEQVYLHWLGRYINALAHMPAPLASEQKLERFLTELAHRDVSASSPLDA